MGHRVLCPIIPSHDTINPNEGEMAMTVSKETILLSISKNI